MALNADIIEAVANGNFKNIGEMQIVNALGHQQRLQLLAEASTASQLERMNTLDPTEAAGIAKVVSSGLSEKLAELNGTIGASMQMIKGAQTTPPASGS